MVTERREQRIRSVAARRQKGLTVVLEDIHDPHNAEAVLRSCDAFGIQQVHFIFEQEKYFDPRKVGKATSSSANKWLDFRIYFSTEQCLKDLRAEGYELIATVTDPGAESIYQADLTGERIAILAGNEHRGLSEKALQLAHRHITIPMFGMVQSLNLSVATALFIYEVTRQRMPNLERYLLSPEEQELLVQDFIQR